MNLIIDIDQLDRSDGLAYTLDGTQMPASVARSMLCRAQINAWYQQADRRLLDLAYDVQYATPTRKLALAIRDSTCRWRHCNTEATRCEATTYTTANTAEPPTSTTSPCCAHTTTTDSTP